MIPIEKIFPFGFILLILSVILGFFLNYKLFSILKEKHPQKWEELGRPSLLMNNNIRNNISVLNFLNKKEYLKMNDKQLTKLAGFLRIFSLIYIVFFIFLLCLFMIVIYSKRT